MATRLENSLEIEEAPPVTEAELERMVKRKIADLPRATAEQIRAAKRELRQTK